MDERTGFSFKPAARRPELRLAEALLYDKRLAVEAQKGVGSETVFRLQPALLAIAGLWEKFVEIRTVVKDGTYETPL